MLAARNEPHLLKIEEKLKRRGIAHTAIREPDMGNSLTAIGLAPVYDRRPIRRVLSSLPLLKKLKETSHES